MMPHGVGATYLPEVARSMLDGFIADRKLASWFRRYDQVYSHRRFGLLILVRVHMRKDFITWCHPKQVKHLDTRASDVCLHAI